MTRRDGGICSNDPCRATDIALLPMADRTAGCFYRSAAAVAERLRNSKRCATPAMSKPRSTLRSTARPGEAPCGATQGTRMSNACHHMTREDRNALIATQRRAEALTAVVRGDANWGHGRHALCGAADLSQRRRVREDDACPCRGRADRLSRRPLFPYRRNGTVAWPGGGQIVAWAGIAGP